MKIYNYSFTPGSGLQRTSATPPSRSGEAPAGDQVQLSGATASPVAAEAVKGGSDERLKKFGKIAAKTGIVLAGLAIGGLTAVGVSSIGGAIGLAGLSLGLMAQWSKNPKIKAMGGLLMLGPTVGAAGVVGALGTGISVGLGVCLAAHYAADAHQLANQLLDR